MILWIDAQISPALAPWITDEFGVEAYSVRYLGLRDAEDGAIFRAAREAGAVVLTKDSDFVLLLEQHGPPPQVLWVTLGNTSNARLKHVLQQTFHHAVSLLRSGEPLSRSANSPGSALPNPFVWIRAATSMREWQLILRPQKPAVLREAPFVASQLEVAGD